MQRFLFEKDKSRAHEESWGALQCTGHKRGICIPVGEKACLIGPQISVNQHDLVARAQRHSAYLETHLGDEQGQSEVLREKECIAVGPYPTNWRKADTKCLQLAKGEFSIA